MKLPKYYILKDRKVVGTNDLLVWGKLFQDHEARRIGKTKLPGGVEVSTVFLGLDHGWGGEAPILFETMIFGGPHDEFQERYATLEQAENGHQRVVKSLRAGLSPEEEQK